MNRREFIKSTGIITAGAMLPTIPLAAKAAPAMVDVLPSLGCYWLKDAKTAAWMLMVHGEVCWSSDGRIIDPERISAP